MDWILYPIPAFCLLRLRLGTKSRCNSSSGDRLASLCLYHQAQLSIFTEVTETNSLRVRLCITLLGILVVVFGFCISFWQWWWKGFATVEEKSKA
ncbi:uncharacterized protein LOC112191501 isoform X2 [Rosa chinensis]|uniref:uncharacterized protein LOC112191501 isoform X2 n=1 Tax=Rosa chinensis TaxID=74649 RepID=UPI000D08CC5B|nr:uncharacterized protein LOC112191501 isoform X2 [Rosa chinensis]